MWLRRAGACGSLLCRAMQPEPHVCNGLFPARQGLGLQGSWFCGNAISLTPLYFQPGRAQVEAVTSSDTGSPNRSWPGKERHQSQSNWWAEDKMKQRSQAGVKLCLLMARALLLLRHIFWKGEGHCFSFARCRDLAGLVHLLESTSLPLRPFIPASVDEVDSWGLVRNKRICPLGRLNLRCPAFTI